MLCHTPLAAGVSPHALSRDGSSRKSLQQGYAASFTHPLHTVHTHTLPSSLYMQYTTHYVYSQAHHPPRVQLPARGRRGSGTATVSRPSMPAGRDTCPSPWNYLPRQHSASGQNAWRLTQLQLSTKSVWCSQQKHAAAQPCLACPRCMSSARAVLQSLRCYLPLQPSLGNHSVAASRSNTSCHRLCPEATPTLTGQLSCLVQMPPPNSLAVATPPRAPASGRHACICRRNAAVATQPLCRSAEQPHRYLVRLICHFVTTPSHPQGYRFRGRTPGASNAQKKSPNTGSHRKGARSLATALRARRCAAARQQEPPADPPPQGPWRAATRRRCAGGPRCCRARPVRRGVRARRSVAVRRRRV